MYIILLQHTSGEAFCSVSSLTEVSMTELYSSSLDYPVVNHPQESLTYYILDLSFYVQKTIFLRD